MRPPMARALPIDAELDIQFVVVDVPVPQGDLAAGRGGKLYHKNKALEPWRYRVGVAGRRAMRMARLKVIDGRPISLVCHFVLYRPKATSKKSTPPAIKKPDLDKLTRAIGDALTGIVFQDDSQIVEIHTFKRIAGVDEPEGVTISVTTELDQWIHSYDY